MRFSIIIPVYNVERYLRDCVGSILGQDYTDYEIILVDDGSPDRCPEICDNLASIYRYIKVVHKKNGGLSSARNFGLAQATGDYVIFLDSDDKWIDRSGLSSLSEVIDRYTPESVIFGVADYNPQTGENRISRQYPDCDNLNSLPKSALTDELVARRQFPGSAWMMATKRDFLNSLNLTFKEGVTAEDFDWLIKIFSHAKEIKVVSNIIYQYRYTSEGSITSKPRVSGNYGIHNAIDNWLKDGNRCPQSLTDYLCRVYLQSLLNYAGLTGKERREVNDLMNADAFILRLSSSLKAKAIYVIIKLFGIKIVSKSIKGLYKKRKKR